MVDIASQHDAPLSSRYENLTTVVIFNNVFVLWERIVKYAEPYLFKQAFNSTSAVILKAHPISCARSRKLGAVTRIWEPTIKRSMGQLHYIAQQSGDIAQPFPKMYPHMVKVMQSLEPTPFVAAPNEASFGKALENARVEAFYAQN